MTAIESPVAIRATGLRKSFGDHVVLDGIDLDVAEGTVFALLGPNGAGKTTMVRILSTLILADGGEARIAGHDVASEPDAVRAVIGVTPHSLSCVNVRCRCLGLVSCSVPRRPQMR